MRVDRQGNRQETVGAVQALCARLLGFALAGALAGATPVALRAQLVHGTVSSAVAAGRVPGAVVLLLDSSLTTRARALTSDSGTFTIGAGAPGRFHLKVMRIGFRPTESHAFDLRVDTTVALALTDIPVILPAVTTRDRSDCRLRPDTTEAAVLTFTLWDQARTALLAAAITLEQQDYRFAKLQHWRVYDVRQHALRDMALRESESHGAAPWISLPAEQLRHDGYVAVDDSGMTFRAPDLDVLLSPYFTEEHCSRLTSRSAPDSGLVGLDFEPAARPRHVEIRGTLWLDVASKELRHVSFTFVNLPVAVPPPDTLFGGYVEFTKLATGAWVLPSWRIRMPIPIRRTLLHTFSPGYGPRSVSSLGPWRLTADWVRVEGGDLRTVRRGDAGDSVLWRRATGSIRILALRGDSGQAPAAGVIVRLAGSSYGGHTDIGGIVRFEQAIPGTYLFDATTPLHEAIEATTIRTAVTVRAGELAEATVTLKPLAQAAADVCGERELDPHTGVVTGRVALGDEPVFKAKVKLEWVGGDAEADTRNDGYFRFCGVPREKLVLVRASRDTLMATTTLTLAPNEIVRSLDLRLQR